MDNNKNNAALSQGGGDLSEMKSRPLTFGEKAVGITFNVGGNESVNNIKSSCAAAIDVINQLREKEKSGQDVSGERMRMYSVAITELQTAQMWAVKAATWVD